MPRSRSRSGSRGGFGSRSGFGTRSSFGYSRPMPSQAQPSYARSPGIGLGIGSTIATGMAFGAGS